MTNRARVYLTAAGGRHLAIGLFLLVTPWLFTAGAFIPIFNLLPLWVWGVLMLFTGLSCLLAAGARNASIARGGMVASATITLMLALGLTIGVAAIWWNWAHTIGGHAVITILLDRPTSIPLDLLAQAAPPASPFLPLIMLAVTVKDFAVCAQPLRVPLEDSLGVHQPQRA